MISVWHFTASADDFRQRQVVRPLPRALSRPALLERGALRVDKSITGCLKARRCPDS